MEETTKILKQLERNCPKGPSNYPHFPGGTSPRVNYCQIMRPSRNVFDEINSILSKKNTDPELSQEYDKLFTNWNEIIEPQWKKFRRKIFWRQLPFHVIQVGVSLVIMYYGISLISEGLKSSTRPISQDSIEVLQTNVAFILLSGIVLTSFMGLVVFFANYLLSLKIREKIIEGIS